MSARAPRIKRLENAFERQGLGGVDLHRSHPRFPGRRCPEEQQRLLKDMAQLSRAHMGESARRNGFPVGFGRVLVNRRPRMTPQEARLLFEAASRLPLQ